MTFLQLQQNVYRRTGFEDTPATAVSTRMKMFLNEVHRRLLALPGMDYLRVTTASFSTVDGTPRYGLPYDVARLMAVRDLANDITLRSDSFQWYVEQDADPTASTGIPEVWVPIGYGAVQRQPGDASTVYVISSSAADSTQTIYVEGIRAGNLTTASATLNGLTKVSLGAWSVINKVYLSAVAAGALALWEDDVTTGTLLATLPPAKTTFRYFTIALWPTPSAAVTFTVDYQRIVADLVNDTDEPLLPEDFHWLLSTGTRMMEYEKQDDSRYGAAKAEYERGVRDLKWFVTQQADNRALSGMSRVVSSRLGGWYPRGT